MSHYLSFLQYLSTFVVNKSQYWETVAEACCCGIVCIHSLDPTVYLCNSAKQSTSPFNKVFIGRSGELVKTRFRNAWHPQGLGQTTYPLFSGLIQNLLYFYFCREIWCHHQLADHIFCSKGEISAVEWHSEWHSIQILAVSSSFISTVALLTHACQESVMFRNLTLLWFIEEKNNLVRLSWVVQDLHLSVYVISSICWQYVCVCIIVIIRHFQAGWHSDEQQSNVNSFTLLAVCLDDIGWLCFLDKNYFLEPILV